MEESSLKESLFFQLSKNYVNYRSNIFENIKLKIKTIIKENKSNKQAIY